MVARSVLSSRRGRRGFLRGRRLFAWQAWHLATCSTAWQAWYFETSTFVSRGRRGFAWQAWHYVRYTFTLCGVALDDMDCYFAWQARHLWHWVGSGGALGSQAAL